MQYSEYTASVTYLTKIFTRRTCVFTNDKKKHFCYLKW